MKPRLLITSNLASLNEHIKALSGNRYTGGNLKLKCTNAVYYEAKQQRFKLDKLGLYDIKAYYITPSNMEDADNVYFKMKYILDGLVLAGVLSGDGRKQIRFIDNKIRTIKGKELIILRFIKIKN